MLEKKKTSKSIETGALMFRKLSMQEIVTPIKKGFVSLREVSYVESIASPSGGEAVTAFHHVQQISVSPQLKGIRKFCNSKKHKYKQDEGSKKFKWKYIFSLALFLAIFHLSITYFGFFHGEVKSNFFAFSSEGRLDYKILDSRIIFNPLKLKEYMFFLEKDITSLLKTSYEYLKNTYLSVYDYFTFTLIDMSHYRKLDESDLVYLASSSQKNSDDRHSDIRAFSNTLKKIVFGQDAAITSLLEVLEKYLYKVSLTEAEKPVIFFTGDKGVGKTFVSSFAVHNFPPPGKAELVTAPYPSPRELLKNFSERGSNLVVIDDVSSYLITDISSWIPSLFGEAVWQNKPLIVIVIFDFQVSKELSSAGRDFSCNNCASLHEKFQKLNYAQSYIHFNHLSEQHIKTCARAALRKQGLSDHPSFEKFVEEICGKVNVNEDGCGTVWSHSTALGLSLP